MAGKNVALSGPAIKLLDDAKRKGESYSDVVLRLGRGPRPWKETLDRLEALGPVQDDGLERLFEEVRLINRGRGRRVRPNRRGR